MRLREADNSPRKLIAIRAYRTTGLHVNPGTERRCKVKGQGDQRGIVSPENLGRGRLCAKGGLAWVVERVGA